MDQVQAPGSTATRLLEEHVIRQTFALEKLQRDGAYACEIRAARRQLKAAAAKLEAARRRDALPR